MTNTPEQNEALVLEAFDTLFNRRDYAAAQRFWSPDYIQHSPAFGPGRDGLFDVIKTFPADLRYENALIVANGHYVIAHGSLGIIDRDIKRVKNGRFVLLPATDHRPNTRPLHLHTRQPLGKQSNRAARRIRALTGPLAHQP